MKMTWTISASRYATLSVLAARVNPSARVPEQDIALAGIWRKAVALAIPCREIGAGAKQRWHPRLRYTLRQNAGFVSLEFVWRDLAYFLPHGGNSTAG